MVTKIRPARAEDAEVLAAMANELLAGLDLETAPVSRAMMVRAIETDRAGLTVLVAEEADGLAGYALFQDSYDTDFGGWTVWMHDLFIVGGARGAGRGRVLLDAVVAEAVKRGAVALNWAMARDNTGAARFYQRVPGALRLDYDIWTMRLR